MKRTTIVIIAAFSLVAAALFVSLFGFSTRRPQGSFSSYSIAFGAPPQADKLPFMSEAGIAYWGKLQNPLELSSVASELAMIENRTPNYVQGIIMDTGVRIPKGEFTREGARDIHLYADKTGLIVVFLRRGIPSSQMAHIEGPDKLRVRFQSIMETFTKKIVNKTQEEGYWHFAYPQASSLTLAMTSSRTCTVEVTIPKGIALLEASWFAVQRSESNLDIIVDGKSQSLVNKQAYVWQDYPYGQQYWGTHYFGAIQPAAFSEGGNHILKVQTVEGKCSEYNMGLTMVYQIK